MKRRRSGFGLGRGLMGAAGASLLVVALLVGVTALPAAAIAFPNTDTVTIPSSGPATPYPSTVEVAGLSGTIVDVNVSLVGFSHSWPADVDVLLVGPFGQTVILMGHAGGNTSVSNADLTFDDGATASVPSPIPSDVLVTCKPTAEGGFGGPAPAPSGPHGSALSVFDGTNPNGTWSLFVFDDVEGYSGSIASGWRLNIVTNGPTITSFDPTSGPLGATVAIRGMKFTGAVAVTFGGIPAEFRVRSAKRITATVPEGAISGPISVTTPKGTGVSSASFNVIPVPTITSFYPTRGHVGATVVVEGDGFTDASALDFNGVSAASFMVNSDTQITVTVPAGASTGSITVTTPGGTATSSSSFVVRHIREMSLALDSSEASGTVTVLDEFTACASAIPVKVQHFEEGEWKTVAALVTGAQGFFTTSAAPSEPGRYRAIARAITLSSGDRCLKAISPTAVR
jgi:subtilisin-like proprotein convertase family protein